MPNPNTSPGHGHDPHHQVSSLEPLTPRDRAVVLEPETRLPDPSPSWDAHLLVRPRWIVGITATVFALVFILPLGLRPLCQPDEFRYADVPRAMIESGDWVVPRLDGLRYFEKPAGGYWLTAVSMSVFGPHPFAIRLPAAVAAGLSALLLALLGARRGEGTTGLLAAAILLSLLEVFCIGVVAILDGPFALAVTAALIACFFSLTTDRARSAALLLAVAGAACGVAFLIKGPLSFVLVALVVGPFTILERRFLWFTKRAWIPAAAASAVVLPWAVAIQRQEPDFWRYFLVTEHLQRFLEPSTNQHPEAAWFFLPVLALGALPWTPLIPAAAAGARRASPAERKLLRFAACWLVLPFLFFSASSGKLTTYILPVYPAIAIGLAIGLRRYLQSGRERLWQIGTAISAAIAAAGGFAFAVGHHTLYDPGDSWRGWLLATSLTVTALLAVASLRSRSRHAKWAFFLASPIPFFICLHLSLPVAIRGVETPQEFLASHASWVGPSTRVVSESAMIQAVCWTYQRDDVSVFGKKGELSYGLGYEDAKDRHLDTDDLRELIDSPRSESVVVVMKTRTAKHLRSALPPPIHSAHEQGVTIAVY